MKKTKTPRLVTISVTTTVTIIFWVFFGLYSILITPPKIDIDQKLLTSLNPTLDTDTLRTLKNRVFFDEGDVKNIPPSFEILITTPGVEENEEEISPTSTQGIEEATEAGQLE